MNVEEIREYALSLNENVTEDMFTDQWVSWLIFGKWFLLMQLDAPEPRVAVKLPPDLGMELRERHYGIQPAYHMNKKHWNDLYVEQLDAKLIKQLIHTSYELVYKRIPKKRR